MDRRVARTRKALHDALMSLILKKGYDAVTIRDIIDEADVGRSTFYSHYAGKQELLRGGFRRLQTELSEAQRTHAAKRDGPPVPLSFSLALFEHANGYKRVYRALVGGKGSTVALNEIRRILSDLVRKERNFPIDDTVPGEVRVRFVVDTFLTVLTWWLERKPGLSPAEADATFRRLVTHGIAGAALTA